MQYAVSVGTKQRLCGSQSAVPITRCLAEVNYMYVAPVEKLFD